MNQPKIPKLKSRYIPVHCAGHALTSNIHWWKKNSPFVYPNILLNLMTINREQIEEIRSNSDEELFLLTDSGGFQIISGTCNLNWETSLLKQIELGASKIFALDTPPVKQSFQGSLNQFTYMSDSETRIIIKENLEIAIKQSNYLKEHYPDQLKKFCYILHGKNMEQINYNLELMDTLLGSREKYSEYFPGGITYAIKGNDVLFITIAARHAYENFIKKGIYVHFLGMGSFNRIVILVRNKISTFDSSSVLQATRANEFTNPIDVTKSIQLGTKPFLFDKPFCTCPVCSNINYNKLIIENDSLVGRHFIAHNLWHILKANVFLDAIPLEKYTEIVNNIYKLSDNVKRCLEFCDYADKNGFEIAYEKYKHYLKKDETKQNTLF